MKISPIIHTRTLYCDFNSEFLVRPACFMDEDIKWARKNILGSTGGIDALQGVRWLVTDNNKYRIAGLTGFLKHIYSQCENELSDEDKEKSKKMFSDDKGRLIYAFIGIVIEKTNCPDYEIVSFDSLWQLYLKNIFPIWERKSQDIIFNDFEEMKKRSFETPNPISIEWICLDKYNLYETNRDTDYKLFLDFLCNKDKTNFAFCSNIIDFNLVKKSEFTHITTHQNTITRLKRENENAVKQNTLNNKNNYENINQPQTNTDKKKIVIACLFGLMIFLTLIILML